MENRSVLIFLETGLEDIIVPEEGAEDNAVTKERLEKLYASATKHVRVDSSVIKKFTINYGKITLLEWQEDAFEAMSIEVEEFQDALIQAFEDEEIPYSYAILWAEDGCAVTHNLAYNDNDQTLAEAFGVRIVKKLIWEMPEEE